MVQTFDMTPTPSSASLIGSALGTGLGKRLAISEAENAMQQAQGDPMKLATSMARLLSASPELARAAGPMYDAMLRNMQSSAYRRGASETPSQGMTQSQEPTQPSLSDQILEPLTRRGQEPLPQEPIPLRETTPGIQEKSILAEETLPKAYWTPQQRMGQVRNYLNLGFHPDKAEKFAEDDERKYMANPEQYQKRFEILEKRKKDALDELKRQLETKTQKKGDELFKDIPGEYLIGMEKGLERDIREHTEKTVAQIADEWSTRALNTAKAKNQFNKFAETQGIENLIKGTETLDKLENYSDIFEKSGNQEEYYNLLRDKMGTSPQGSAIIAFKLRPELKNVLNKNVFPMSPQSLQDPTKQARSLANSLSGKIQDSDSLLSIAWEARQKNRMFDERSFFDQISRNKDMYNLNDRQIREISEGASRILPYWGDILIFPKLGKRK